MEVAPGNGIFQGSVGLGQAHPLTKPPATRKQPSAGLGLVAVRPLPIRAFILLNSFFLNLRLAPADGEK